MQKIYNVKAVERFHVVKGEGRHSAPLNVKITYETTYEWIFLEKRVIVRQEHYNGPTSKWDTYSVMELNATDVKKYEKQVYSGDFNRDYKSNEKEERLYREWEQIHEIRKVMSISNDECKEEILAAMTKLVENGKTPNLNVLKRVFNDEELQFYFPNLFPRKTSPPVFINNAHIGDSNIAGGDIIDGYKIIGDTGMIKMESQSNTKAFSCCPFCGQKFNLTKTPLFCPYCGDRLM